MIAGRTLWLGLISFEHHFRFTGGMFPGRPELRVYRMGCPSRGRVEGPAAGAVHHLQCGRSQQQLATCSQGPQECTGPASGVPVRSGLSLG